MTLAEMIKKLEGEYLETSDPRHRVEELAYRKGHNDRNRSLIAWAKVEAGLVELEQNAPVDLRVKDALVFDTSDEHGGEG